MALCCTCTKRVNRGENFTNIKCSACSSVFHAPCVNMNPTEVEFMSKNKKVWNCVSCTNLKKSVRLSIGDDNFTNSPTINNGTPKNNGTPVVDSVDIGTSNVNSVCDNDDIKSALNRILCEITEIKSNINKNSEDTNKNFTLISEQMKSISAVFEKIELIEKSQQILADRIAVLEKRFDDLEQQKRQNSIIVHGLQTQTEPIITTMQQFFMKSFDLDTLEGQIDKCIKLNSQSKVSPILIKFNNRDIINQLFKLRSKNANKMKAVNNGRSVFINEDLTSFRRNLLNEAKTAKKLKNYKFLWIRNGSIMLRKDNGDPVVFINSKDDIRKII